ncbi:MAG: hypothetical protein QOK72_11990 [Nitrososphaeraceae archaeon]|nr:hypothetical protein [Nitrososphaeraceae archaeon]
MKLNFLDIIVAHLLPVTIPILAQIPTITVINGYRSNGKHKRPKPNFTPS